MNDIYKNKVDLLLRVLPSVVKEDCFAIHGGTAINLFHANMRRLSVDIDLTYIPLDDRQTSLRKISAALIRIKESIKRSLPGVNVNERLDISKLTCSYRGVQIKIEVNQTKRGIVGGEVETLSLCDLAQEQFRAFVEAPIVPISQLYGGKIAAALSRQHPRDLFDVHFMDTPFDELKIGIIYALLGSDRPILESLAPNLLDQRDTMESQFRGMSDIDFPYETFEETRTELIKKVNESLTEADRQFLIDFEAGEPNWENPLYKVLQDYPSIKWKQLNIQKLKKDNNQKLLKEVDKLRRHLDI